MSCVITTIDPNEVETTLDRWSQELFKLRKQFLLDASNKNQMKLVQVIDEMKKAFDQFRQYLPLIRPLCNEAFQTRHWIDLLHHHMQCYTLDIEEGFSLTQLLEAHIQDYLEAIEEKSELAMKEYNLKNSLVKMKFEWKAVQISLLPYRDSQTCVMKGFDAIQSLLDDHVIRTQTMRGSKYLRCIEHQSRDWESKLLEIQQILDALQECQKSWMYLYPIFQSQDISKQITATASLFAEVDQFWRHVIQQASQTPNILDIVEFDNLHHHLVDANLKLARVLKGVSDFLETKRLVFPRFFFLSNEELLAILSQTRDLRPLQTHLNKCFEGIHRVIFNEEKTTQEERENEKEREKEGGQPTPTTTTTTTAGASPSALSSSSTTITAITSSELERIRLVKEIHLTQADGTFISAEKWLGEVWRKTRRKSRRRETALPDCRDRSGARCWLVFVILVPWQK